MSEETSNSEGESDSGDDGDPAGDSEPSFTMYRGEMIHNNKGSDESSKDDSE